MLQLDSNLTSALVGALVGGAASLAGSTLIARRELTRTVRINMFDVLVPSIQEAMAHYIQEAEEKHLIKARDEVCSAVTELRRASIIAGRSDANKVEVLHHLCSKQQKVLDTYQRCIKDRPKEPPEAPEPPEPRKRSERPLSGVEPQPRFRGDVSWDEVEKEKAERRAVDPRWRSYAADLDRWQVEFDGYVRDFFAIDHSIVEQLDHLQRYLARKIRQISR